MSTPAAIVFAAYAVGMTGWLALTRNGHRLLYVILVAVHRLLVPATGERAKDQPAGVRAVLREIAASAWWQARDLAGRPRLWLAEHRIERAVRGCVTVREDLPAEVRHPDAEEVPVLDHPGRALPPGAKLHPYRDRTPTRAERYSLRVPSYHSDPAEAVGAATGDFPRLMP